MCRFVEANTVLLRRHGQPPIILWIMSKLTPTLFPLWLAYTQLLVQSIILDELLNAFHHIHVYIYSIYLFITEYTPHASFRSVESSIHWWNPWFLWLIPSTIRLGPWARSGRCTMHTIGPAQGVAFPWRGEDPWSWKNIGLVAVEYPHICVIT